MQATACRLAVRSARAQRATRRISGTARPGTLLHGAPRAAAVASAAVASGATAAALCASSYAQCIPRTRSWEDIPPQVLKDIQFAIRDGEVGLLKVLLRDHRVSVSTTINVSGKTLLAFTAERGQLAAVRYLLKRGADVNATGGWRCLAPADRPLALTRALPPRERRLQGLHRAGVRRVEGTRPRGGGAAAGRRQGGHARYLRPHPDSQGGPGPSSQSRPTSCVPLSRPVALATRKSWAFSSTQEAVCGRRQRGPCRVLCP